MMSNGTEFLKQWDLEREEAVKLVTEGLPSEGGHVRLETLQAMVRASFDGGVLAAIERPPVVTATKRLDS